MEATHTTLPFRLIVLGEVVNQARRGTYYIILSLPFRQPTGRVVDLLSSYYIGEKICMQTTHYTLKDSLRKESLVARE